MPTTKIDNYTVLYSSNKCLPRIWLRNNNQTNYIGQVVFLPDGETLPHDIAQNGDISLYYHLQDFPNILDILRNENPVYLSWTGPNPGQENGIWTSAEPAGEGES